MIDSAGRWLPETNCDELNCLHFGKAMTARSWNRSTLAIVSLLAVVLCFSEATFAQTGRTMGRNGWRWHSSGSQGIYSGTRSVGLYGGAAYVAPYYGWGFPYYGYNYNYGTQTAYGNAASARADLIKAQGQASKSQAEASVANEQARQQYLENQEKYLQMRQEQKAVIEARKAKEREERQEQIKSRPQKKPTDLYPRLSIDQLDSTAGVIHWPDSLKGTDFDEERNQLNDAVRSIAEHGPSERLATSIKSTVDKMKTKTQPLMAEVGFEEYSEVRKFLGSLSVEGYYALEEL